MYLMFNIVAEEKGVHGAVLIRAIEPIEGIEKCIKIDIKSLIKPLQEGK